MYIGTDLTDVLFGTPTPVITDANLGALDKDKINIAVHGHNPLLSQMVVYAARELEGEAKAAGAQGINLVGICCTGNEVLMREGVPSVANFGSQELVIMTGVLDSMVMDVQCIAPRRQGHLQLLPHPVGDHFPRLQDTGLRPRGVQRRHGHG